MSRATFEWGFHKSIFPASAMYYLSAREFDLHAPDCAGPPVRWLFEVIKKFKPRRREDSIRQRRAKFSLAKSNQKN
jgi:hypothetical protein